ncbi:peptidoglycan/LPS O-acetylase OafA/YrhL [Curtobacterium pusillum]|uniref:Peptidoglycan/LPS O-acetylase OafA/YrhL n=1 Tax=Curtobacterium pusillum TaxID=69373 RepID=A0AAW3T1S2_9MICO|nr:acyltransferase family protein [Curtobacterium pusillum]MBA8989000.1 peptidoglycan/LPS O-acetylase OafA/YrhL [Curtobacterium pusillum]
MTGKPVIRQDLNAMRAVAVLSVVAVHSLGIPAGGWVGVDVFFALSGYLIVRSMLSEWLRTGHVAVGAFFRRRFWRLFPAAVTTLVVVSAAAVVALRSSLAASVVSDSGAAALGVVNWVFLGRDADYWAAASATSPVQHFWSLSVELQYYAAFPLLLLVVRRSMRSADPAKVRRAVVLVSLAVLLASLAWAAIVGVVSPGAAYFDTGSRLWELAAGSCLGALSTGSAGRTWSVPNPVRVGGVVVGFAVIALSTLTAPAADAVPVPDAVPAVVGALLVLFAGQGLAPLPVLRWRPVQWIGDASYSIYLWHFPAVVAATYVFPGHRIVAGSVAIALGVVLGAASRRWVELPAIELARRPRASKRVATVAAVTVLMLGLTGVTAAPRQSSERPAGRPVASADERWSAASLEVALQDGLRAVEWPTTLSPSLDDVAPGPPVGYEACDRTDIDDPASCRYASDAPVRQVTVLGSSVGVALMPAVHGAFGDDSIVRGLTASGCPMLDISVRGKSEDDRLRCIEQRKDAIDEINRSKPDIVIVTHAYDGVAQLVGRPAMSEAGATWGAAARSLVGSIRESGARVVFVAAVPEGAAPGQCAALRTSGPDACGSGLSDAYRVGAAAERRVAAAEPSAAFVDSSGWYCVDDRCPILADDVLVRKDGQHLTQEFAERLAPVLREAVLAAS